MQNVTNKIRQELSELIRKNYSMLNIILNDDLMVYIELEFLYLICPKAALFGILNQEIKSLYTY